MRKLRSRQIIGPVGIVALLSSFVLISSGLARHSQDSQAQPAQDQQTSPSTGPATQPGETVLVPKKTQPAPAAATAPTPEEKKPEKINPKQVYTISTTTNLVSLDVLVTDKDGNPIPSLTKTNFKVFDDGVEQTVSNFGTAEDPMTV